MKKFILLFSIFAIITLTSMDTAEKVSKESVDGCTTWYVESFTDPVHGGTYNVYKTYCSCGDDEPCTPYSYYTISLAP